MELPQPEIAKKKRGRPRKNAANVAGTSTQPQEPKKKRLTVKEVANRLFLVENHSKANSNNIQLINHVSASLITGMTNLQKRVDDKTEPCQFIILSTESTKNNDLINEELVNGDKSGFEEEPMTSEGLQNVETPTIERSSDDDSDDDDEIKIKPEILKKFRPPISKYKQQEATSSSEVNNYYEETATVTKSEDPNTFSDFAQMNAWLARKKSDWCVKLSISLNKMLTKEGLIATHKCMVKCCSYTSISQKNFVKHLLCHEANGTKDFIYFCPYCFFNGKSSSQLMEHYNLHKFDKYQCGYCFYRSCEEQSCYEHHKMFHVEHPLKIYECPLETFMEKLTNEQAYELVQNRQQFIQPMTCSSCDLNFYLIDAYENHMEQHARLEIKSEENVVNDFTIYKKLQLEAVVGLFQCLFCTFGCEGRDEIKTHMQNHPSKRLYYCKRKPDSSSEDQNQNPHSVSSVVISLLLKATNFEIISFDNDDLKLLKNSENVLKISDLEEC
ncbi:CLUMA_CG012069, isoform A [Clunio marinus]|uniref:CLUMA_CG012069, isoform A n=1 Tax=Clunio marinus TaxID=568069 RepID=A0A1J1IFP9_9DIPT|nr:CLUMA_CG012069, isoform A [Clunio marinus]